MWWQVLVDFLKKKSREILHSIYELQSHLYKRQPLVGHTISNLSIQKSSATFMSSTISSSIYLDHIEKNSLSHYYKKSLPNWRMKHLSTQFLIMYRNNNPIKKAINSYNQLSVCWLESVITHCSFAKFNQLEQGK